MEVIHRLKPTCTTTLTLTHKLTNRLTVAESQSVIDIITQSELKLQVLSLNEI